MFKILVLALFVSSNHAFSAPTNECVTPLKAGEAGYDILIIAGQSNAVGYGKGIPKDPEQLKDETERIVQIGRRGTENFQVIAAAEPLAHWDSTHTDDKNHSGFGLPFARRYAKQILPSGRKLLLVPAAFGGTNIAQWNNWKNRAESPDIPTYLFDDMVARIRTALSARIPGAKESKNRIVGLLWHQGEANLSTLSDPKSEMEIRAKPIVPTPKAYGQHLSALIKAVRAEFPDQKFPVLAGEPPRGWKPPTQSDQLKADFREAIADSTKAASCATFVPSEGLEGNKPGDIHFSAAAQLEYGARFFKAYQGIVPTKL